MTRSSTESKTSHAVVANLSELELKKILIDKIESNKSIYKSDEQKNLYKAFVKAYESDKLILDTYGDIVSFKRHRDNKDKDEEPSARSNRGSKRRRAGKEPESTNAPKENKPKTTGKSTYGSKSQHKSAGESAHTKEPMHTLWICVTKLEIVEWQNYKHLDWITVRRDDDKLYKFKEGDLKRLRIQDIEDMLLLVQGKLTNLTVKERLAFNVSLRMFTRSIVIQRRVEDLQLAYSTPRGFIYQNKDKKNRLMRIDELHKFSDGTLDDVQIALNDRLKEIRMQYLPQTIRRQRDKENARAIIQAIKKKLKTRRIMRSLKKFVGGRPYEDHVEFDESDTHVLERLNTSAGNPVKEILLKLNLPDHRNIYKEGHGDKEFQRNFCHSHTKRLSLSDEVLKLKNFKKDATINLFKSTNQERYEHVGSKVTSSQDGKVHEMAKQDYAWLMISRCSKNHIQDKMRNKLKT
ncbi:hypothetical protein Tco_1027589 [Tanacetum coccineum]